MVATANRLDTMAKTKTIVISALDNYSKISKKTEHQVEEAATAKRIKTVIDITLTDDEVNDNDNDDSNANIESSLVDRALAPYESWDDDRPLSIA